jgi:hypothetical protein
MMGNWKHEELVAFRQAFDQLASAPRAEGKCQAMLRGHRADWSEIDLVCLECGYESVGSAQWAVDNWNSHIIFQ